MWVLAPGFSINFYSCTHHRDIGDNEIHCDCGVKLICLPGTVAAWDQQCLHTGARSRMDTLGDHMEDTRGFACIHTKNSTKVGTRVLN